MLWKIYENHWKILMVLPIILLVVSVVILAATYVSTGYFVPRGTEFQGGKTITIPVDNVDLETVKEAVPYGSVRLSFGAEKTLLVEIPSDRNETEVVETLKGVVQFTGEPSIKIIGPVVAQIFFQQAQTALVVAFIFMAVVVSLLFRSPAPAAAVIFAAVVDIVATMAVMNVLDIRLSFPVLAALLTIIGYSVDTDILLTTEMLKGDREKEKENIQRAMKTGLTLTATALVALLSLYFLSGSAVLEEIASVLIIGLLIDMPATWFTNAGLMRLWLRRK